MLMRTRSLRRSARSQRSFIHNATRTHQAATLLAPLQGPQHPHRRDLDVMGGTKLATGGYKEEAVMEKWNFHDQFHTFHAQVSEACSFAGSRGCSSCGACLP